MKTIQVFESVDGEIFRTRKDAEKHDLDCIGEEFDGLMLLAIGGNGNITRHDQFRMCMALIDDKNRAAVTKAVNTLHAYLNTTTDEDE